jgi:hypothetical protein
LSEAIQEVGF